MALTLLLAGCADTWPVPGWQRATELASSPVPFQEPLANEVVALGNGEWRFDGARVSEADLLRFARASAKLLPRPALLVDFSRMPDAAEKRRMMIAIASAAGCSAEFQGCIEGTRAEYQGR